MRISEFERKTIVNLAKKYFGDDSPAGHEAEKLKLDRKTGLFRLKTLADEYARKLAGSLKASSPENLMQEYLTHYKARTPLSKINDVSQYFV